MKSHIKRAVKDGVKRPIGRLLNVHRPSGKPDVFIFSVGRSGSNWMMEIIQSQREFRYSNQPFWRLQETGYARLLPPPPEGEFITLDDVDEARLLKFVQSILEGRLQVRPPWNVFSRDYSFVTSRSVLKVLHATSLIDWFCGHFNIYGLFLLRHPIPRALSMSDLGWKDSIHAFLHNESFVADHLDPEMVELAERIEQGGTERERHVVSWCLENLVPLRGLGKRDWSWIAYEELVLNPIKTIDWLCETLNLSQPERMYRHVGLPSRSSSQELRELLGASQLESPGRIRLISRWKKHLGIDEESDLMGILKVFGIDVYAGGSVLPRRDVLHFADTAELSESTEVRDASPDER